VVYPSGPLLKRPTDEELAACLGVVPTIDPERLYDIAVAVLAQPDLPPLSMRPLRDFPSSCSMRAP
jgi:hypothetical protein